MKQTKEQSALKIMCKTKLLPQEIAVVKEESDILKSLAGKPNIVNFRQMYETRSYILIEMEHIPGGHLKRLYEKRIESYQQNNQGGIKQQIFSEEEASQIIKGVLTCLVHVHELDIIHRDLKLENILLQDKNNIQSDGIQVIDFGLSARFKANPKQQIDDKIGTLLFMAPEQISLQNYGKKIDIFACGIILYYLLCGEHPLYVQGDSQISYKKKVTSIEPDKWEYPCYLSKFARDLICRLCTMSSVERYDAKRALLHPFITRNLNDKIPLTRAKEFDEINLELALQKVVRLTAFFSIMKQQNQMTTPDDTYLQALKNQCTNIPSIVVMNISPKNNNETKIIGNSEYGIQNNYYIETKQFNIRSLSKKRAPTSKTTNIRTRKQSSELDLHSEQSPLIVPNIYLQSPEIPSLAKKKFYQRQQVEVVKMSGSGRQNYNQKKYQGTSQSNDVSYIQQFNVQNQKSNIITKRENNSSSPLVKQRKQMNKIMTPMPERFVKLNKCEQVLPSPFRKTQYFDKSMNRFQQDKQQTHSVYNFNMPPIIVTQTVSSTNKQSRNPNLYESIGSHQQSAEEFAEQLKQNNIQKNFIKLGQQTAHDQWNQLIKF